MYRQAGNVIFKEENLSLSAHGMKVATTGEFLSEVIDPNDLEMGKKLGSGASGTVHLAKYKPKNIIVAVKSINIFDKAKRDQFKKDLKVLSDNKCPFLVHFYGANFDKGRVNLFLEYMDLGSLENILATAKEKKYTIKPLVPEDILCKITLQILQGLLYLNKVQHQIHRDIKPANILINSDGIVKLTDFGISKTLKNSTDFSTTFVGTKNFMSPERIIGKGCNYNSDIWSLGLVVYELASGVFPYNVNNSMLLQIQAIQDYDPPRLPDNGTYSKELQNFIEHCLQKDPKDRDSVIDLLNHPWIQLYQFSEADVSDWLVQFFGKKN